MFFGLAKNEISLIIASAIVVIYLSLKYGRPFLKSKRKERKNLIQSQFKNPDSQSVIDNKSGRTNECDAKASTDK